MTPKQVLIKAREHISDPSMWVKGKYSDRGVRGAIEGLPCCMSGAIMWACDGDRSAETPARTMLCRSTPGWFLLKFNDDPNTTHQDVLDVFDKAIEVVE